MARQDPGPALRVRFWMIMLIVTLLAALASAQTIRDGGGFFSDSAKAEAETKLSALSQKAGGGVVIETFAQVPPEYAGRLADKAQAEKAMSALTHEKAKAAGASLYVFVSREPSKLGVIAPKGVSPEQRKQLTQELVAAFKAKDYDRGLLGFASSVATLNLAGGVANDSSSTETLPASAFPGSTPQAASEPRRADAPAGRNEDKSTAAGSALGCGSMGGIFTLIIIAVVVMFLIRIIRGFSNRNRYGGPNGGPMDPNHPGYQGQGQGYNQGGYNRGGGGGFGTGVAGGLAGGLLGGWLGSQVFGQGGSSAQASEPNQDAGGNAAADPDQNQDFSGGDFSGGDDFSSGGGDSGGGDFSGGDF